MRWDEASRAEGPERWGRDSGRGPWEAMPRRREGPCKGPVGRASGVLEPRSRHALGAGAEGTRSEAGRTGRIGC